MIKKRRMLKIQNGNDKPHSVKTAADADNSDLSSNKKLKDPYTKYEEDEGTRFKEIDRQHVVRKKKHTGRNLLCLVAVAVCVIVFALSPFFEIRKIEVKGNKYYSDDEIITMADARTGGNLFSGLRRGEITERLMKDVYITDVNVSRKLPDTVEINVDEKDQIAAIAYGNRYVVIDKKGLILRVSDVNPKITLLTGLTLRRIKEGKKVQTVESKTLEMTLNMLDSMKKGNFFFKKIEVSDVLISAYVYDNLIVRGTPEQMKTSIDRGDVQKVVNKLFKNGETRGTISLGDHNYVSYSPSVR